MEKKKPYFDPYIYENLLKDLWLPPIAKEILEPWKVSHRHKFLFGGFKERAKEFLEKEEESIKQLVDEETSFQISQLLSYIGSGEKEKQEWLEELREVYDLPTDYKFR